MANMPYCRFQNTLPDLRDCQDHLWDGDPLDEHETEARRRLLKLCEQIAAEAIDNGELEGDTR